MMLSLSSYMVLPGAHVNHLHKQCLCGTAEGTRPLPGTHVSSVGGGRRGWEGCGEMCGCLGISSAALG